MKVDTFQEASSAEKERSTGYLSEIASPRRRYLAGICFVWMNSAGAIASADLLDSTPAKALSFLGVGLLFGILFGQAICLSLWSSWGQGSHLVRFLLMLAAEAVFAVSIVMLAARVSRPDGLWELTFVMLMQVAFVYSLAWLLRFLFGLRIVDRTPSELFAAQRLQFGIVHIMGINVAIAILLVLGQVLAKHFDLQTLNQSEFFTFLFLLMVAILIAFPIFVACLAAQHIIWMLPLAILSTCIIGAFEQTIYNLSPLRSGPELFHFIAINIVTFVIVLTFAMGMRLLGYRLTIGRSTR
jgi:hypothetical protein